MEINKKTLQILEEKGLIRIGELSDLSGHIAVDAELWLDSILPLDLRSSMMGSISMSLRPLIQEEISRLQSLNKGLSLTFVFPGLPLFEKANIGVNKLWSSNIDEQLSSVQSFPRKHLEFPYVLFEILRNLNCDIFQAPYLPSAQMAYFWKSGLCSDVVGGCDLLFYRVPRIITEIMHTKYKYVRSQEVFETLELSHLELKRVFVLSGYLARFYIDSPLGNLLETIKYVRMEELVNEAQFIDEVVEVIDASVVFALQPPRILCDMSCRFLGKRLPRDFYFALSNLHVSQHNFTLIAFNRFYEKNPVAESNNYRRMLRSLKDLKAMNLSVLHSCLPPEYHNSQVKIQYWYSEIEDEVSSKTDSFINWKIDKASLTQALSEQRKHFSDLQFCMKWHSDDFNNTQKLLSSETIADSDPDPEVVFTKVLLTFLECTSYIYPKGLPTLFGTSFLNVDPEWQTSAFYMQELLKYGMLNGRTLSQTQCMQLTEEEFQSRCLILTDDSSRHAIFLISRVFSLVQPTLNEEVWTGEVDYDLAQFHSLVHAIFKNYQQLFEAIVIKEFIKAKVVSKTAAELCRRSPLLPLPNPALGIAVKRLFVLDNVEQVAKEMPQMTELFLDLQRGWMFWKKFVKIMGVFNKHGAVPEKNFINEISNASKKLKEVLIRARIKIN